MAYTDHIPFWYRKSVPLSYTKPVVVRCEPYKSGRHIYNTRTELRPDMRQLQTRDWKHKARNQ